MFPNLARVRGSIGPANHVEDRSLRLRGIKVVVKGRSHSLHCAAGKRLHIVPGAVRKRSRGQTYAKVTQAFDRNRGLLQSVKSKVELMTIGDRRKQISDRRRPVSLQHKIAKCKKVAQAFRHLLAFDQQKTCVEPEVSESLSRQRF